jgi:hypothetical protein
MIDGRRVISAVVGGLLITAAGYADMVPASQPGAGRGSSAAVYSSSSLLYTNSLSPFNSPSVGDLGVWPVQFLPEKNPNAEQVSESQHPQALTDGTSSLSLCLSALMGLGLCGSVHWIKRLHWGAIPEWYHDGGPFQVGHSHALTPNSLCTVTAYCFIQPDYKAEDSLPLQYRLGIIMSLWRESQFTQAVIASRAPPSMS